MVTDRLPFGVVEMKTAWVADDPERSRALTNAVSRTPLHAMPLLDIQFIVATAASYVLKRWLSSGGLLASRIPATPYPDHRYQTKLAWWDRATFAKHADPKQLSAFVAEQKELASCLGELGDVVAAGTMR
jgi:ABC-type nitrate/sulfonate/bicarbonate transport system substrate-binding protein